MNLLHFPSQREEFLERNRLEVEYKAENGSHFKLEMSNVILQNRFHLNLWSYACSVLKGRSFVGLFSHLNH